MSEKGNDFGLMAVMLSFLMSLGMMVLELWSAVWRQTLKLCRDGPKRRIKALVRWTLIGGPLPHFFGHTHMSGFSPQTAVKWGLIDERYAEFLRKRDEFEAELIRTEPNPNWQRFKHALPFRIFASAFNAFFVAFGIGKALPDLACAGEQSGGRDMAQIVGMGLAIPTYLITYFRWQLPEELYPYTWEEFLGDERRQRLPHSFDALRPRSIVASDASEWIKLTHPALQEVMQTEVKYGKTLLTQPMVVLRMLAGADPERACEQEMKRLFDEHMAFTAKERELRLQKMKKLDEESKAFDVQLDKDVKFRSDFHRRLDLLALDFARQCSEKLLLERSPAVTPEIAAKLEVAYWNEAASNLS
ncbi:MAG: hypothetical protein Q8K86_05920 [Candidatus Nanopelagicaceae bacterium]|nr:hypothetical protein [Candidatus Nanopelagicaceae bacterium]